MILHRMSWNCTMTQSTLMIENYMRNNTLSLRQNSMSFYILFVEQPLSRRSSPRSSLSGHSNQSPRSHVSSAHIKLPVIALSNFECDECSWLHYRDTFEALIVNNTALYNVKKFHYLIASLQNEGKYLISNLQITNENSLVAWQLVTQCYNNKRLIAMMHVKLLSDATSTKG